MVHRQVKGLSMHNYMWSIRKDCPVLRLYGKLLNWKIVIFGTKGDLCERWDRTILSKAEEVLVENVNPTK